VNASTTTPRPDAEGVGDIMLKLLLLVVVVLNPDKTTTTAEEETIIRLNTSRRVIQPEIRE